MASRVIGPDRSLSSILNARFTSKVLRRRIFSTDLDSRSRSHISIMPSIRPSGRGPDSDEFADFSKVDDVPSPTSGRDLRKLGPIGRERRIASSNSEAGNETWLIFISSVPSRPRIPPKSSRIGNSRRNCTSRATSPDRWTHGDRPRFGLVIGHWARRSRVWAWRPNLGPGCRSGQPAGSTRPQVDEVPGQGQGPVDDDLLAERGGDDVEGPPERREGPVVEVAAGSGRTRGPRRSARRPAEDDPPGGEQGDDVGRGPGPSPGSARSRIGERAGGRPAGRPRRRAGRRPSTGRRRRASSGPGRPSAERAAGRPRRSTSPRRRLRAVRGPSRRSSTQRWPISAAPAPDPR